MSTAMTRATELAIKPSAYEYREQYLRFNALFFQGQLPTDLPLLWDALGSKKVMGYFRFVPNPNGRVDPARCSITLDTSFDYTQGGYDGVLLHEMVHAYLIMTLNNQSMELGGHHPHFQEELDRVDTEARSYGIDMPPSEAASMEDFATGKTRQNMCIGIIRKPGDPAGLMRFSVMQPSVFTEVVNNFKFKLRTGTGVTKEDIKKLRKAGVKTRIKTATTDTHSGQYYLGWEGNAFNKFNYESVTLYQVNDGNLALMLSNMGMANSQRFVGNNYWICNDRSVVREVSSVDDPNAPSYRPDVFAALMRSISRATGKAVVKADGVYVNNEPIHTAKPYVKGAEPPAKKATASYTVNGAAVPSWVTIPEGFLTRRTGSFHGMTYNSDDGYILTGEHEFELTKDEYTVLYVYDEDVDDADAYNNAQTGAEMFNSLPVDMRHGPKGMLAAFTAMASVKKGASEGVYVPLRLKKVFDSLENALGLPKGTFIGKFNNKVGAYAPESIWSILTYTISSLATPAAIEGLYKAVVASHPGFAPVSSGVKLTNKITAYSLMQDMLAGVDPDPRGGSKMWTPLGIYLSWLSSEQPWEGLANNMVTGNKVFQDLAVGDAFSFFNSMFNKIETYGDRVSAAGEDSHVVSFAQKIAVASGVMGGPPPIQFTTTSERYLDTLDTLNDNARRNNGILSRFRVEVLKEALTRISARGTREQKVIAASAHSLLSNGTLKEMVNGTTTSFDDAYAALAKCGWLIDLFSDNPFLTGNESATGRMFRAYTVALYVLGGMDAQLATVYRDAAWDLWDLIAATSNDTERSILNNPKSAEFVLPPGWTEATPGGLATNTDPLVGGIIDKARGDGKWFIIFNRNQEPIEGLESRAAAFEKLAEVLATPEPVKVTEPKEEEPVPTETKVEPKEAPVPESAVLAPKVKVADGVTNWNITIGVNAKTNKLMFVPKEQAVSNNIALVRKREAKPVALFLSWVFHEELLAITAKIKNGQRKRAAQDLAKIANSIKPYVLAVAKEQTPFPGKLAPKVAKEFGDGLAGQKQYMRYLQGKATSRLKLWKDVERLKDLSGILGADVDDEETAAVAVDTVTEGKFLLYKMGKSSIEYKIEDKTLDLISLRTPTTTRGQGNARQIMQTFLSATDKAGLTVSLLASPLDKKTRLDKLVAFYKSLGFVITGRGNMAGEPTMVRKPELRRETASADFNNVPWQEIAKGLSDVGVRGGKMYLAARLEDFGDEFFTSGKLVGVKGVSSAKRIWADFSPNAGRDTLFVMEAAEVLRLNKLTRVGYDNPDRLIANNSRMLCRILSTTRPMDNLISGVFGKMDIIRERQRAGDDVIAVANKAQFINSDLQRGRPLEYEGVDEASFPKPFVLSTYEDYANLYYQAAKAAGWHGKPFLKLFAPQARNKWLPAIKQGIVAQASIYADESEWVTTGDGIVIPKKGTKLIIAMDDRYMNGGPQPRPITWRDYQEESVIKYTESMDKLRKAGYQFTVVDATKTQKGLESTHEKRRKQKPAE